MKISDVIIDMHQGINTVADKVEYLDSGIPIIQSKNFTKGYLDLEDVRYLGEEDEKKYIEKYNPHVGDILMANIGTIGKSYVISEEQRFLIAWNAFLIKPNAEKVKSDFLKFYFDYLASTHYFDGLLTGGTVKFINKKKIGDINIPDKSLAEQSEICNVLSQVEKVIIQRQQEMELLDDLIKARFVEMFGNLEEKVRLGDCCEVHARIGWQALTRDEHRQDGEYMLVTGTDFVDGRVNYETCVYVEKERYEMDPHIILRENDVLITKDGSIGKVAVVHNLPKPATLNGGVFVVRPDDRFNKEYISYVFRGPLFERFVDLSKTGATIKHLNQKHLVEFRIPLPTIEEQEAFAEFSKQIDKSKFMKIDYMNKTRRFPL